MLKKKRGRPRKPVELHLLQGTFRPDRHGPRPKPAAASDGGAVAAPLCSLERPALTAEAERFAERIAAEWSVDDPVAVAYLRAAQAALARWQALEALLDGPGGLLATFAAGTAKMSAKGLDSLLRAQRQAAEQFGEAVDRLDLDLEKPHAEGRAHEAAS